MADGPSVWEQRSLVLEWGWGSGSKGTPCKQVGRAAQSLSVVHLDTLLEGDTLRKKGHFSPV